MEIHRPKPFHNWRELAKEVGVISIGIAIALGGEETLRWLDRRAEAAEARETLRAEIAANAGMARFAVEQVRCSQPALRALSTLAATGAPHPPPDNFTLLRPSMSTWEVVKTEAAARIPLRERERYAQIYDMTQIVIENVQQEVSIGSPFAGLWAKPVMTESEQREAVTLLGSFAYLENIRAANSRKLLDRAKALGIEPAPVTPDVRESLAKLCRSVGLTPGTT